MSGLWAALSSIRFRLTAWYSLLLTVVLCAAGYGLLATMQQSLRDDLDQRLMQTASTIGADGNLGRYVPNTTTTAHGDHDGYASDADDEQHTPGLDHFPGTVIQINGSDGTMIYGTFPFCQVPFKISASGDGLQYLATEDGCGTQLRVLTQPIELNYQIGGGIVTGSQLATLVVAQSLAPLEETMHSLRVALVLIGLLGISLAMAGGWILAGRVLAPIDAVTDAAAKIAESDRTGASLSTRLEVPPTTDEVARLSVTFNRMLDRLQSAFDTREQFVANASHELRTPLAAIRGNLDVLSRQLQRLRGSSSTKVASPTMEQQILDDLSEAIGDLQRESGRMGRLLDDLLFLARADRSEDLEQHTTIAPIRLDEVVSAIARIAEKLTKGQKLSVSAEPVTILGDADRITQLTLILLDNAIRHTPADKEILVTVGAEAGRAVLRVADKGEGIPAEHLPRIFDRFYRVDTARSRASGGSGLGLSIAKVIAEEHQAEIIVESTVGRGSTFTFRFPLGEEVVAEERSPERPALRQPLTASPATAAHSGN